MQINAMAGFLLAVLSMSGFEVNAAAVFRASRNSEKTFHFAAPTDAKKPALVPHAWHRGGWNHGKLPVDLPFLTKIPDIKANLHLAQQWMSVTPSPNVTFFKQWASANGLPNTSVADAPQYYNCGLKMNTAWGALARDPCSWGSWSASDEMKAVVPECAKLRYGDAYTESYKALKLDQDTWCGSPKCGVRGDGKKCLKCARSGEFPFDPQCLDNVAKLEHSKATAYGTLQTVVLAAMVSLSSWSF